MAKELLIVFVYDCERCQKEEDDPQDAVVYFYPSWVSEQQRLALCGQLMGVTQFLNTVFSPPNILSLQTGKFAIKSLGRYILCVGTDRNIPDLVLDTRINILYRLLRFYHRDFENLLNKTVVDFSDKIVQIFETYLPILQYAGNIFGSIPTFNLPKSASSVFLEAIQILQCFQSKEGVLGGVLLYQNKVVATQLSADLTKLLVVTDPYRIKLPGEAVSTQFRLPVGVQLMTVYVEHSELVNLEKESSQLSAALTCSQQWRQDNLKKSSHTHNRITSSKEVPVTTPGFGMKRDVSRIFTVVEEVEGEVEGERVPDVVRDAVKARKAARLLSVAPGGYVVPEATHYKGAQTTDIVPDCNENKISIRYCSLGKARSEQESVEGDNCIQLRPYYNTISDPTFPLFRHNGLPASQALYDNRVTRHYHHLSKETAKEKKQRPQSFAVGLDEETQGKKKIARRILNLPLSSTTTDTKDMVPMADLGSKRSSNMSIPLTPLMAKLSLLAMEEKGEVSTPTVEKSLSLPKLPQRTLRKSRPRRQKEKDKSHIEQLDEKVLYVCGYQDMTLHLLMDLETSQDPDQIHSLWQMSVGSLSELESRLHHCLEHFPSSGAACESYSFLSLDPGWGMVHRGGAWAGARLELLTTMHQNFNSRPHLTETIVRSEDSIVYGYQCGGVQVFYQQGCIEGNIAGLPAPSDLMGVVALKAKRRLERDHGIIIL